MLVLGMPSDYASAGSVQTAPFKKPSDAYSKASVFAADSSYQNAYQPPGAGPAVAGTCPPGTVQQGLVCAQIPNPQPPTQPPPSCPAGLYWNGGECVSSTLPPAGPQSPPTTFWDVGQNPPPAGAQVIPGYQVTPAGYFRLGQRVYPKWWVGLGLAILGAGAFVAYRRA